MHTPSHVTRQVLAGAGTPAPELAAALRQPLRVVWAVRESARRCAHLGEPLSLERELEDREHAFFDALMRSNRSVCG